MWSWGRALMMWDECGVSATAAIADPTMTPRGPGSTRCIRYEWRTHRWIMTPVLFVELRTGLTINMVVDWRARAAGQQRRGPGEWRPGLPGCRDSGSQQLPASKARGASGHGKVRSSFIFFHDEFEEVVGVDGGERVEDGGPGLAFPQEGGCCSPAVNAVALS